MKCENFPTCGHSTPPECLTARAAWPPLDQAYTTIARAILVGLSELGVFLAVEPEHQGQPGINYDPDIYVHARRAADMIRNPERRKRADRLLTVAKDAKDATLLTANESEAHKRMLAYHFAVRALHHCASTFPTGNPWQRELDRYWDVLLGK
jgi:hypothetical protein